MASVIVTSSLLYPTTMASLSPQHALVALNLLPRMGPVRVQRLLQCFEDPAEILGASMQKLMRADGIGPEMAQMLHHWEDYCDLSRELAEVERRQLTLLTRYDAAYPESLRQMYDQPLVLYVWGEIQPCDRHAVAIVGSRRATHYGQLCTKMLAYQLATAGVTILSGLARGIDTLAHESALAAQGRTIAVIGSGLARLYPPENMPLAEKIVAGHGAIVSEFPLFIRPDKTTFPQRNRLVAAWSRALLVTECPAWSGALITANLANEYGRPVFAVPGPITQATSMGCHQLIRDGATLCCKAEDILSELDQFSFVPTNATDTDASAAVRSRTMRHGSPSSPVPGPITTNEPLTLNEQESAIFRHLSDIEQPIDRLIELSQLPAGVVTSTLLKLELRRLVRALPGFRYARR